MASAITLVIFTLTLHRDTNAARVSYQSLDLMKDRFMDGTLSTKKGSGGAGSSEGATGGAGSSEGAMGDELDKQAAEDIVEITATTTPVPQGTTTGWESKDCLLPECPESYTARDWIEFNSHGSLDMCFCRKQFGHYWASIESSAQIDYMMLKLYRQTQERGDPYQVSWKEAMNLFDNDDFIDMHVWMAKKFPFQTAYWENNCFDTADPQGYAFQSVWGQAVKDNKKRDLINRKVDKGKLVNEIDEIPEGNATSFPSKSFNRILVVPGEDADTPIDEFVVINRYLAAGDESQIKIFMKTIGEAIKVQVAGEGPGWIGSRNDREQPWKSLCVATRGWVTAWVHVSITEYSDLYTYMDWMCTFGNPQSSWCRR